METTTTQSESIESMMKAGPQKEHRWLQQLVGDWTFEAEATTAPGEPPTKTTGTESVRSLGGLWTVAESEGEMPGGGTSTAIMTLGYDPERKRYVGTWIGAMMTHLWLYEGSLDASERVLTLDCEGPSMKGDGAMARYQDVIEIESDDHRVLRSHVLSEDGTWKAFMTAHYRRRT